MKAKDASLDAKTDDFQTEMKLLQEKIDEFVGNSRQKRQTNIRYPTENQGYGTNQQGTASV